MKSLLIRFGRWFVPHPGTGIALLLGLLASAPAIRADHDSAQEEVIHKVVAGLQKVCAADAGMRGALISNARVQGPNLRLQGFVDRIEQTYRLQKEADTILADISEGKKLFPGGTSTESLIPLRGTSADGTTSGCLRAILQGGLADNNQPDHPQWEILRLTRIDDLYYDNINNCLTFVGVCLYPRAAAVADPETGGGKEGPPPVEALPLHQKAIAKAITSLIATRTEIGPMEVNVKGIALYDNVATAGTDPIRTLQRRMVEELGHDDILLTGWYDSQGCLQVEGLMGRAEYREEIERYFRQRPSDDPCFRPGKAAPGDSRWSLKHVAVLSWPLAVEELQGRLAEAGDLFQQTRLDRVYLTYAENGMELDLHVRGVCCQPPPALEGEKLRKELQPILYEGCCNAWPPLKNWLRQPFILHDQDIVSAPQPGSVLQARVADTPALDGTTIMSERCHFRADGRYVVTCLLADSAQKERLDRALAQVASHEPLTQVFARGYEVEVVRVIPISPMLEFLRRAMAADPNFDGIRLERIYHNAQGQLVCNCNVIGTRPGPEIGKRLEALLESEWTWKWRCVAGVVLVPATIQARDPELADHLVTQALTHLEGNNVAAAEECVDAALRHNPQNTTAWFASAWCHLVDQNPLLAEQDLRRMTALEKDVDPSVVCERMQRLERLQGSIRDQMNNLLAKETSVRAE